MEHLEHIPHDHDPLSESEYKKIQKVVEDLHAQGHEFKYDDTSHTNEILITLSVDGQERVVHLTKTAELVPHFADAIKATIMFPECTLTEGLKKISEQTNNSYF